MRKLHLDMHPLMSRNAPNSEFGYFILNKTFLSFSNDFMFDRIGHFHDDVILLQLPEFISFSFSNSNFLIPVDSKVQ